MPILNFILWYVLDSCPAFKPSYFMNPFFSFPHLLFAFWLYEIALEHVACGVSACLGEYLFNRLKGKMLFVLWKNPQIPCKTHLLLQASFEIKLFTLMQHFSLYRKSPHEEDIEKRRISKLQRSEHQKAKRKMGIGKQIEKVCIQLTVLNWQSPDASENCEISGLSVKWNASRFGF